MAAYPACLAKDRRGFRTNSFSENWYQLLGLSVRFSGLRTPLLLGWAWFVPFLVFFFAYQEATFKFGVMATTGR